MKNLTITYVHNMRLPTEKAHGYQIAKMCEAFADLGHEVRLVVPRRKNDISLSSYEYYNVKKNFKIQLLPIVDALAWPLPRKFAFAINSVAFFLLCILLGLPENTVIYTRTPELVWLFGMRGFRVIFECHQLPRRLRWLYSYLICGAGPVITITAGLKDELIKIFNIPAKNIFVAPDGVDLLNFDIKTPKQAARSILGLPLNNAIVVYTGQLIKWKGVDTLAEAAKLLGITADVYFIGGTVENITEFRSRYPDAKFNNLPNVPRNEVALWLKAADVLVLPNTAKEAISARHTSPLKLFEYMTSGTPIVASDLPSIREVLDESMAVFSPPDDPQLLAHAIKKCLFDPNTSAAHAKTAKQAVLTHTWSARAKTIVSCMMGHAE